MDELAKASGISRPTLSKYFEDPSSVRVRSRERIEAALEASDYRPNLFARNLNRKRTRNIGIIVPHLTDPFLAQLVSRLEMECRAARYWPIVISAHGSREAEAQALDLMHQVRASGVVLVAAASYGNDDLDALARHEVPVVACDIPLGGGIPFARTDNRQSIGLIVDYLCRTGTPPCYFQVIQSNANALERRMAYIEAMERHGNEPMFVGPADYEGTDEEQRSCEAMLELIDGRRLPSDSILCMNDRTALGALAAAGLRRITVGRRRGSGLRIAGYDDIPMSRFAYPPLTTVAQDFDEIARRTVELLLDIAEERVEPGPMAPVEISARLMVRRSA